MQAHELLARLGDVTATPEQRAALLVAADTIAVRYPGQDSRDEVEEAFSAAVQVILGDVTLAELRDAWEDARRKERAAMISLTGAIIATAQTTSENAIAKTYGINRMTVRKALGK